VKMRDNLEDTVQAFNASVGSVERSFLSKARKLVELNAAGDEMIPQVDPIDELEHFRGGMRHQHGLPHALHGAFAGTLREGDRQSGEALSIWLLQSTRMHVPEQQALA